MERQNWYKEFFSGLAVEMWHQAVPQAFTDSEIVFILKMANPGEGSRILDVCCGSGRTAIPLAKKGFEVTGIDISPENIAILNSTSEGLSIQTICGDVLEHNFQGMYDHVLCMGNSFSYFDRDGMVALCRNIFYALMPGARFIANTGALAESLLPNLKDRDRMEVNDIVFLIQNEYLTTESVLKTQMKFVRREQTEIKTAYHFVYSAAEMIRILLEAGFRAAHIYGDTKGNPYNLKDPNAYIVAEK